MIIIEGTNGHLWGLITLFRQQCQICKIYNGYDGKTGGAYYQNSNGSFLDKDPGCKNLKAFL